MGIIYYYSYKNQRNCRLNGNNENQRNCLKRFHVRSWLVFCQRQRLQILASPGILKFDPWDQLPENRKTKALTNNMYLYYYSTLRIFDSYCYCCCRSVTKKTDVMVLARDCYGVSLCYCISLLWCYGVSLVIVLALLMSPLRGSLGLSVQRARRM